jgi:hypothetical protein
MRRFVRRLGAPVLRGEGVKRVLVWMRSARWRGSAFAEDGVQILA